MIKITHFKSICYSVILAVIFFSCQNDDLLNDPNASLAFSTDTVQFDTIFTETGSTTRTLMVYNPYSRRINISSIRVSNGSDSKFKLIIDGESVPQTTNIELLPKDSLFIFVSVYIDPNNKSNPLIVSDSLLFETNGNLQKVQLQAYGLNVTRLRNGATIDDTTWTAERPVLIFDSLTLTAGHTLTIEEGTRVYFHRNAFIKAYGNIQCNGTVQKPIRIQSDRLDKDYYDFPGLWGTIRLLQSGTSHSFNHTQIVNSINGIEAPNTNESQPINLNISNSAFYNSEFSALDLTNVKLECTNTVFAYAKEHLVRLQQGSTASFYHCTFYNGNHFILSPQKPAVLISDKRLGVTGPLPGPIIFANTIIWGFKSNEIDIQTASPVNVQYQYSLIRTPFTPNDPNVIESFNENPRLKAQTSDELLAEKWRYVMQLDTLSPAKDKGSLSIATDKALQDAAGNDRTLDSKPDLGAFERIEKPGAR